MNWKNRWAGCQAACLASGPSLTDEDIARVFEWRDAEPGARKVVVTNTTFQKAPRADALFAHDFKWWRKYIEEVQRDFTGARVCSSAVPATYGVDCLPKHRFKAFGNSGTGAVSLAILAGCTKVILLGVDCMKGENGETHHHGNHPQGLGNAYSMPKWPRSFESLATYAASEKVDVVNCSRRTILKCFRQAALEDELGLVAA